MDEEEQKDDDLLVPAVDEVRMFINQQGSLVFSSLDPADRETSIIVIPRAMVSLMIERAKKLIKESAQAFK